MALQYTNNIDMLTGASPAETSVGVTATTTSQSYDVSLRRQITVQFHCANHTSGNGVFSIDVSNDGANWVTGIGVQPVATTTPTIWVESVTLSANGSAGVYVPAGWRFIRCLCTVTTDGTYFADMEAAG